MSLRPLDHESYWAQLSASNPLSQSLEGAGTGAQLDAPKAQSFGHAAPTQRPGFKPDI